MNAIRLVLFTLMWTGIVYGYNCLLVRKIIRVDFRRAGLYFLAVALIGVSGEIFLDTVYKSLVGTPLLVIIRTVERFKQDPRFFSLMSASLVAVIIFMT
jgi:hypothetical protein